MHVKKKPPVTLFSLPVPAKKMKLSSLVRLILPQKGCYHHEKELPAIIEANKLLLLLFCLSTFFISVRESKLGLHKSFWYCKKFDALIVFFVNTFLPPFKFFNFVFNILIS